MKTLKQVASMSQRSFSGTLLAFALMTMFLATSGRVLAGPGAHGPNGEHLDAPVARVSAGPPRFSASSEAFELVGELERGVLTLYLDRYQTNEPVTGAKIELDSGAIRATAQYQADREIYQVVATDFIAAISKPGEHSLIITVLAGRENDLLDTSLQISAADARSMPAGGRLIEAHDHRWELALGVGFALLLVAAGLYGWRQYLRKTVGPATGASQ